MNLANPDALLWALLAVPVTALFLLRIRLRQVPVPTTMFWRKVFEQKESRSLWRSLRYLLSLLAQLLFLGLLVLALAEPVLPGEAERAQRIVLVLDNSASMSAADVAPSRLARARDEARRLAASLRAHDELAVVSAATEPQVVCGFTSNRGVLARAIDGIPATHGPTRVAEAVALARRLLADHEHGSIVVVTDGCFAGAEELAGKDDLRWVLVGRRTANTGITAFQARRNLSDPAAFEAFVEVAYYSDDEAPLETRLVVELNGLDIDVLPLTLPPNQPRRHVVQGTSVEGGRLRARLEGGDALEVDNEAWAVLPALEGTPVHLATPGNLFLLKVFEAHRPLVKLTIAGKEAPPPGALQVFHRKVPPALPKGPVLVIDPEGGCDLWQMGKPLVNPVILLPDRDSPLMANLKLDQFFPTQARRLLFADAVKPRLRELAMADGGEPIYCAVERPEGKVLVLALSLDEGNLPLRLAFPVLVGNALNWFAGDRDGLREAQPSGAVLEVALPAEGPFVLRSPDGIIRPLAVEGGRAVLGPLDRCGVWAVEAEGGGAAPVLEVACNLADPRESDLRPARGLQTRRDGLPSGGLLRHPLWFYLLLAAGLFIVIEWYLYQRRVLR